MAIGLSISPLAHPWLAAKLLAIVVYIVIGSIALKRGRTHRERVAALVLSLLVLVYIFAVALRHDPFILPPVRYSETISLRASVSVRTIFCPCTSTQPLSARRARILEKVSGWITRCDATTCFGVVR